MSAPVTLPEERRDYRDLHGNALPGVTDVLQMLGARTEALMDWARIEALRGNDWRRVRQLKADTGTCSHGYVERHLRGDPLHELGVFATAQEQRAHAAYKRWAAWYAASGYSCRAVECALVDEQCGYGGRIDMVLEKDTHAYVTDYKTGKKTYAEHVIQLSAYAHLLFKHGIRVSGGLILHFPIEGEPAVHEISGTVLSLAFDNAFLPLLTLHKSYAAIEGVLRGSK